MYCVKCHMVTAKDYYGNRKLYGYYFRLSSDLVFCIFHHNRYYPMLKGDQ